MNHDPYPSLLDLNKASVFVDDMSAAQRADHRATGREFVTTPVKARAKPRFMRKLAAAAAGVALVSLAISQFVA